MALCDEAAGAPASASEGGITVVLAPTLALAAATTGAGDGVAELTLAISRGALGDGSRDAALVRRPSDSSIESGVSGVSRGSLG